MIEFAKRDNNKQYISISTWAKDRRLIGNLYDYISERYPSIKSAPLKMDDDEIAISLDNSGGFDFSMNDLRDTVQSFSESNQTQPFTIDFFVVHVYENGEIKRLYSKNRRAKVMRKKKGVTIKPTMNIIERKITAGAIYQNAVKIGEKILAWVPVELLNIQSYQRDRQRYAASIAENWDDTKCDVLKVSYDKENGWFNIIDGQHRAAAAKMRGIEYLVCEILTGLTESRESTIYVEENTTSKKLSPFDTYKANQYINGADKTRYSDTDKRIKAITEQYGIPVCKSAAAGVIKSVPQIRQIIEHEGEDCLRFIFDVIQASHWDNFVNGYSYVVVNALRKVYNSNKRNDLGDVKTKLCGYFIKKSPREVEAIGNSKYANLGRTARFDAVLADVVA